MTTQPKALNLARMRSEFEHWRSDGSGRGRIPERLWRAALSLLDQHSIAEVARELGINRGRIRAKYSEVRSPPSRSPMAH